MNKRFLSILYTLSLCVVVTACSAKTNTENNVSDSTTNSQTEIAVKESESIGDIETYRKLSDGQIIVNTNKEEKTYIQLNGVDITCSNSAPIYVQSSEKTVISLAEKSKNYIKDGSEYKFEDETSDEPNAEIFSKEDLTFIDSGSLEVSGNYDRGIVSKDDLVIENGNISVTSVGDGIRGKDSVVMTGGNVTIKSGQDGIQSNNTEDTSKGYVLIQGGKLNITS